jgi:hypothetical protein
MSTDDREGKQSLFGGLPGYNETIAEATGFNPGLMHTEVPCGDCEELRAGTRTYTVVYVLFLGIFVYFWHNQVLRCPRCMRAYLGIRLLPALLAANLLAPIVLVWWLILLLRTLR